MYILPVLPKINRWHKINNSIFPPTNCTAIVPFNGKLNSTLGLPKITKFIRDCTYLNTECLGIFIGILLGDAYIKKPQKDNQNVRIGFKQSIINLPYMYEVFTKLSHYCNTVPRVEYTTLKIEGKNPKIYKLLVLETRCYPVLNILRDLFHDENGVKVIKPELFHYITPISLAHLIMCDGLSNQYGLTICTDCFTVEEVVRLINILKIKFYLDCNIHYLRGKPRIYVLARSMTTLRNLVAPYFIDFSLYKLNKGRRFN